MKIVVDVDDPGRRGMPTPELAATLRGSARLDVGSTAINLVLGFGAVAVAAGLLAPVHSMHLAAALGLALLAGGYAVTAASPRRWGLGLLGAVWMVVGALALAGSVAAVLDRPLLCSLVAAAIFILVALLVRSHPLIALAPLVLAAIGGSAGYGHAFYQIAVSEPTLTIALYSLLAFAAWRVALAAPPRFSDLALTFTRVSVVLVNIGFWLGSLWGDSPSRLWLSAGPVP
jgi:hypothetical protein